MEDVVKSRPVVPEFRITKTHEEQYMVVENIKNFTAMRQGFDLLFTKLTGRKP